MTPDIKIVNLYSGSKGNCTFISSQKTSFLIDAGKSAKTLCDALTAIGEDIRNISAIFVTHEHSDHIGALSVLSKKFRIPIHITEGSAAKLISADKPFSPLRSCLHIHSPLYSECFTLPDGNINVSSFETSHDSLESVGYRVEIDSPDGTPVYTFGYATDTGCITEGMLNGLSGCESVIIEANHDVEMLRSGPYPYELKMRILSRSGHLSNAECASLASALVRSGTKNIMLAHLSEENNTPQAALDAVRQTVPEGEVNIFVASPCKATSFPCKILGQTAKMQRLATESGVNESC